MVRTKKGYPFRGSPAMEMSLRGRRCAAGSGCAARRVYATGNRVRTGDATRIRALSAHEMAGLQPSFFLRTPYGIRKGC